MENEVKQSGYDAWKSLHKVQLEVIKSVSVLKHKTTDLALYWLLGDEGNRKLPTTTAIFSMGSAATCPSKKLGLCKAALQGANCYARKAEYLYPSVLPYRNRQEKLWKNIDAEEFAYQFLTINSFKKSPFSKLRVNESGDFWGQSCVDKLEKIARILKKFGVVTYCYTSRDDLDYRKIRALKISGSGFKKEGIVNEFRIIKKKEDRPSGFKNCPMNCRICERCSKARMNTCIVKH